MKITYVTAGAAGMFCGSCMHDNTLVAALRNLGHDALLVPTYTPIRTDEADVSTSRVFFGGINVFLQQKSALFRHTPWSLDRLLDARSLLSWVSRFAVKTQAEELGELTLSMLRGEHGHQKKEIEKLLHWLENDHQPEIIHLTNVLLSGMIPALKARFQRPVLASLQGDDIFLEALPENYRRQALELIRANCRYIHGYLATSRYYADFMAEYLHIPRERIDVVYPGLNLQGHGSPRENRSGYPFTIGYFARICPEKGLHILIDAFRILKYMKDAPPCRLRVSGWLGENHKPFFEEQKKKLETWGLTQDFEYVESPDHASKVRFFHNIDVLSVPTIYREPKGLYVLEAWANGVPVVQPRHGSFPELVEETGGGVLVNPDDPADLASALKELAADTQRRHHLGLRGKEAVERNFHAAIMAEKTVQTYRKYLP